MHAVRRGHLYLGLFLLPWAVLYGVTGFLFNHPTAFSDQETATFSAASVADTPMGSLPLPAAVAGRVVAGLNERAENGDSYTLADPSDAKYGPRSLAFATAMTADGRKVAVLFDVVSGGGTVREQPASPVVEPAPAPFAIRSPPGSDRGGSKNAPGARSADVGLVLADPLHERVQAAVPVAVRSAGFADPTEVTVTSVPDLTFRMTDRGGLVWRVTYNALTGAVAGNPLDDATTSEPISVRRFLTRLHLSHGYPNDGGPKWYWAVIVDAMAFVMVFWGVSGLLMWWQIKATRRVGIPVIAASLASATALAMGMHAMITGA